MCVLPIRLSGCVTIAKQCLPPSDVMPRSAGKCRRNVSHGAGFWSLTRFNEVEQASRDWKTFSSRLGSSIEDETEEMAQAIGGMLNMDAPEHVRLRRIVNKSFAPTAMASLMKSIHDNAVELVDNVVERGECDFARDIATPYPVAVICDLLGAPPADRKYLQQLTTTALCADLPEFGGREGSGYQAFADLNDYGAQMARERRANPRDDMIGLIVATNAGGEPLSDEEVGIYFQLLVTAGIETTGTATSQGMLALMNHPEQRSRWSGNFDALADTAVEELVRYTTPIIHFARTATRDLVLGGHEVSAGDKVVMWYNSSNRDEAEFAKPNGLDLGRVSKSYAVSPGSTLSLSTSMAGRRRFKNFSRRCISGFRTTIWGRFVSASNVPRLFSRATGSW